MKIVLLFLFFCSYVFSNDGIIFNFAFMKNKQNIEDFLSKNKELDLVVLPKDDGSVIRSKCIDLNNKEQYLNIIKNKNLDYFILKDKCNFETNIIKDNNVEVLSKIRDKKIDISIPEENFISLSSKNLIKDNDLSNAKIKLIEDWKPKILLKEDFKEDNVNDNIFKALSLIEKNDLTSFDYFDNILYNNTIDDNMKNYISYQYGKFSYISSFDKLYELKKFNKNQRFYFIYGLSKSNNYYDMAVEYLYRDFDPLLGALISQELYKNDKKDEAEKIIDKSYDLNKYNPYIILTYIEIKFNLGKISKEEQKNLINKVKKFNKEMEIEEWVKKYY